MTSQESMAPGRLASQTLSLNMRLLAHHELAGFGGMGEGMSLQLTRDGRRVLWLAHESAPKNFSALDVTNAADPKLIVQTDLPHAEMRSNSLDVVGDLMAVAYQTKRTGLKPAGFDLFDVQVPEQPRLIAHYDTSGPHSRGAHCLFFVDGEHIHLSSGAADFEPSNEKDHQCYQIIDVRDPSRPTELGRWWYPGTRVGDSDPPPPRHPRFDAGYRPHNCAVYPNRPDRAYVAYIDGGAWILDISDMARPRPISQLQYSPPYNGFTHTVLPLFERELLIISDECVRDGLEDWPKPTWIVDARLESNLVPIAQLPLPDPAVFGKRGGRYGSHNMHENQPLPSAFQSETIIFGTFFAGGVRAYDVSDPIQPREIAYFVPGAPPLSRVGAIQINDVWVDERGVVYAVDRFAGGLYILELNI